LIGGCERWFWVFFGGGWGGVVLELNGLMLPDCARDWREMVNCAFFCALKFAFLGCFKSKKAKVYINLTIEYTKPVVPKRIPINICVFYYWLNFYENHGK